MPVIGRKPPADIIIPHPQVSARHAELRALGGEWFQITDLGSTNGTFVNSERIQTARIRLTDPVRLGTLGIDLTAHRDTLLRVPARTPQQPAAPRNAASAASRSFALALIGAAILVLATAGALYATRQTVVARCEICGREIFHEETFFWDTADARQRASRLRWCQADGDAPVTVHHVSRCEYCGKVIDIREETRPRREQPQGSDRQAGFCSDQCRLLHTGREIYREGKSVVTDGIQKGADALRELGERLRK